MITEVYTAIVSEDSSEQIITQNGDIVIFPFGFNEEVIPRKELEDSLIVMGGLYT